MAPNRKGCAGWRHDARSHPSPPGPSIQMHDAQASASQPKDTCHTDTTTSPCSPKHVTGPECRGYRARTRRRARTLAYNTPNHDPSAWPRLVEAAAGNTNHTALQGDNRMHTCVTAREAQPADTLPPQQPLCSTLRQSKVVGLLDPFQRDHDTVRVENADDVEIGLDVLGERLPVRGVAPSRV